MIIRRVLGFSVGFGSDDPEMMDELETLTAGLAPAPAPADFQFSIQPGSQGWVLAQDGAWPSSTDRTTAFSKTMGWLLAELLARSDLAFIHAGVVAKDGAALVLPAMSGSGKSTLTAALVRHGFQFCSDELAPLDSTLCIRPYPLPARIREGAVARLGELGEKLQLFPTRVWREDEWSHYLLPVRAEISSADRLPVGLIGFPRIPRSGDDSAVPEFRRLALGDATMRFMSELLGPGEPTQSHFDWCSSLVSQVPCYDVAVGTPSATARALAELWEAR